MVLTHLSNGAGWRVIQCSLIPYDPVAVVLLSCILILFGLIAFTSIWSAVVGSLIVQRLLHPYSETLCSLTTTICKSHRKNKPGFQNVSPVNNVEILSF